jgi:anti-anti-sigma factor
MAMNLEQDTLGSLHIMRIAGRLDSVSAPELEAAVTTAIDGGARTLVFDFNQLDYISSAGLRVVLVAGKRLRVEKGKLALAGLKPAVQEVFDMSGFLALFTHAPTVDDALAKLP